MDDSCSNDDGPPEGLAELARICGSELMHMGESGYYFAYQVPSKKLRDILDFKNRITVFVKKMQNTLGHHAVKVMEGKNPSQFVIEFSRDYVDDAIEDLKKWPSGYFENINRPMMEHNQRVQFIEDTLQLLNDWSASFGMQNPLHWYAARLTNGIEGFLTDRPVRYPKGAISCIQEKLGIKTLKVDDSDELFIPFESFDDASIRKIRLLYEYGAGDQELSGYLQPKISGFQERVERNRDEHPGQQPGL
ncbi:MAG: hypothetical protein KGJ06_00160 [Pseudomonadota bacterium]|nr:hypothetical protein [Pseudomonadota bacterium]